MIVDASVAIKWFVPEELHEDARQILQGPERLIVPDLLPIEFANAMRSKARSGEYDEADARIAIEAIAAGRRPEIHASAPYLTLAFEIANVLDHPVYDCVYLALAEQFDTMLVTADRRFFAAAADAYPRVQMLGGA